MAPIAIQIRASSHSGVACTLTRCRNAYPHHLRDAACIVAIRLVDLRLQHRLHVPRFNTDHRYFAGKKILSTLPKMAKAAQSADLKEAFEKHRDETEGHVARLEKIFAAIDKKPQAKTCDALSALPTRAQRS
jgi:hypothetical protein